MAGTTEGGRKSAARAKVKYGSAVHSEWARKADHTKNGRFGKEPGAARAAGLKGGAASRRSRTIKPDDNLRPDEWELLRVVCNKTSRKMCNTDAIDIAQDQIWHAKWADYVGTGKWQLVMTDLVKHSYWPIALGVTIKTMWLEYDRRAREGDLSKEELNQFRLVRNLATAWKLAAGRRWDDI